MTTPTAKSRSIFPASAVARLRHEHAILDAFERVESGRRMMQDATHQLIDLIDHDPEWRQRWDQFLADGGITLDELCRWMVLHKAIRPMVKRQRHLRLVVNEQRRT